MKTTKIDTSKTNPADFLAGSGPAPVLQPGSPGDAPAPAVEATPEAEAAPVPEVKPKAAAAAPTPAPAAPAGPVDPFILLGRAEWGAGATQIIRTMRAMPVPGGVVLKCARSQGENLLESLVFIPDVAVKDGQLVKA